MYKQIDPSDMENIKYWGLYGLRYPCLEEKYPVLYKPCDMDQLTAYMNALLVEVKEGTDIDSSFIKEFKQKVLPLVFHPIEFKNLYGAALEADLAYEKRHASPTCFCDSMCTINRDTLWGALEIRLEEKITSMRHERAFELEQAVLLGTINKEDVWFEYAFYRSNNIYYFRRVALQMRRMKDRKLDVPKDMNAWTSNGQYNTHRYEHDDHALLRTFPWGIGL